MDTNKIRQRALPYMPQNAQTPEDQLLLLAMLEKIVPTVRLSREKTQRDRWPRVQQGEISMQKAIESCAYEVNNLLRITVIRNLKLEEKPEDVLLQAWAALDYYIGISRRPEYAEHLREYQDYLTTLLQSRQKREPKLFREVTSYIVPDKFADGNGKITPPEKPRPEKQAAAPVQAADFAPTRILPEVQSRETDAFAGHTQFLEEPQRPESVDAGQKTAAADSRQAAPFGNTQFLKTEIGEGSTAVLSAEEAPPAAGSDAAPAEREKKPGKAGRKKYLLIAAAVLAVVLVLPMLSKVSRTQRAIDRIGQVTYAQASGEAIEKAEALYAALEEEDRAKIENYDVLLAARMEYNRLETENAISLIGPVTLASEEAIETAEALYEALTDQEKRTVDNYSVLTAARKEYDRLVAAVQTASDAIDAIGTVTLESGEAIRAAREAYDALETDQLQDAVADKIHTLLQAEQAYADSMGEKLYEEAVGLHEKKKYQDALDKYLQISEECPGSAVEDRARKGKADCQIALARQTHQRSDLYNAMLLLKAVEPEFQSAEEYQTVMNEVTQKLTKARPTNGKVFTNKTDWGWCQIDITAEDSDLCVKIVDSTNGEKYQLIYVREGETVKVKVKDGVYSLLLAAGQYWYGTEHLFGDDTVYGQADNTPSLYSYYEGSWVYYKRVTVTMSKDDSSLKKLRADQF